MSRKRFRIRNFLIIIAFLAILFNLLLRYYSKVSVDVLEFGEIEEIIKAKAVIIKDEVIVYSDSTGNINYHYNEGQKVNSGALLVDVVGSEKKRISSPKSGFISYVFDGLENSFKIDEVLDIMPSKLQNIEETIENTVNVTTANSGDKLLKVINNFEYYLACLVNNVDIVTYEEGKYIRVRFEGYDKIIYGQIKKINSGNDVSILIIGFDEYFHKVYNKRIIEVSLVKNLYEGIKLNKEAVIEKDGIKGVYVKDVSNIIKFIPIEIIGGNSKYYIVTPGETMKEGSRGVITINDVTYYTVKVFDKLVLKPEKVYEGQIVD